MEVELMDHVILGMGYITLTGMRGDCDREERACL